MESIIPLNIFLLAFFFPFQMSLSVPHDVKERSRNEQSNTNFSELNQDWTEEIQGSVISNVLDICGLPVTNGSDDGRMKRSERYLFNDSTTTESPETTNLTDYYSHLSERFLNCSSHINLEPECYEKLPNRSVYVPLYKMVFNISDYFISDDFLFLCPDFFFETETKEKFLHDISIISIVGSSISEACLILHVIIYFCIKTVKSLLNRCLLSLCFALIFAYFFTFVERAANDEESCRVVGMFMVYFFLAAFFWMNVFSYNVCRSIMSATTNLKMTEDTPMMVRFTRYSVYAWGSPLMIVILSIIIHNSTSNVKYQLIFGTEVCWFVHKQALTLYFAGPIFTLLGINILLTVASFVMISTASKNSNTGQVNSDLWSRLFLSLRLGTSMGLMWIFGVLAIVTKQEWMWYLFAVCSALQGVFVFFSFTVSERSRTEWKKSFQSRKGLTMPTEISCEQTSSV